MIIETLTKDDLTLEIHSDQDGESPREWDNLGTMVCFHSRYNLGDKHQLSVDDALKIKNNKNDKYIVLPLYLYEHSGITMNTTGFCCPWDSRKVGIIYVDKKKVRAEYGWKVITKKRTEIIKGYLKGEVNTYDQYLRGEVYGFTKYKNGELVNSCWGFYGDDHKASGLFESADWEE